MIHIYVIYKTQQIPIKQYTTVCLRDSDIMHIGESYARLKHFLPAN